VSLPDVEFTVGKRDGGKRLDAFLHERIPGLSRTQIQRAIRERVTLSWGVDPRPARPVIPGGVVHLRPRELHEEIRDVPIPVLARGDGWLAVDKPAGLPVHPVNRTVENTVIRMLRRQQNEPKLRLTHRLDRETSGVLLVADSSDSARVLTGAFERGEVRKEYLALVQGNPRDDAGTIERGKPARTDWRVVRREGDRALLRIRLHTGRRHQIRVHLEALGHPVLGDILYGRPDADYLALARGAGDVRLTEDGPRRQLLHCALLAFGDHEVEAPLPADFESTGL
jgi:23S rRNA pseudouridine1911/1915/1917 synthase